jgi:hypothetical protein
VRPAGVLRIRHFCTRVPAIRANGLRAAVRDVTIAIWDRTGDLPGFLQQLADDFRGWPGKRTWRNNQLTIDATFRSGGHVELKWKLRPWTSQQAAWEASVTTWIEGGQQLAALASDVRAFLALPWHLSGPSAPPNAP